MRTVDPVALAAELIRRPSVTPDAGAALDLLEAELARLGFGIRRMRFCAVDNLYARLGAGRPHLCFAGHLDVVPPGPLEQWRVPPFEGRVEDGLLLGRGAADMKGAVAAFVAAAAAAEAAGARGSGSLSLLITADEEGPAVDGTRRVVETLEAEGEAIDACIVGEPTSAARVGDLIKVGRRGSLNAELRVEGVQGHVAYPDRAANPIPVLIRALSALSATRLDDGFPEFQPSNLEITDLEVGNPATNVIPPRAAARLNVRFNPAHRGADLLAWIRREAERAAEGFAGRVEVDARISGEAFLTPRGPFVDVVAAAVAARTGSAPELSTSGGTSDARFIRAICPVVELGLVGATMHKANEAVPVADVRALAGLYEEVIVRFMAARP